MLAPWMRVADVEGKMGSRRLVIALVVVNLLLVAALLAQGGRASAASDSETLRARAIELVDERGRISAG